jgi:oligoribonuclease NrnB/cAMP/cGMP phosphodiesterase (DHH superfamily)
MRVFYHLDPDGCCAAAIAAHYYGPEGNYVAWRHEMTFPYDDIKPGERVVFVDINLPDRDRLWAITNDIVWIDHHISAIEKNGAWAEERSIAGIRSTAEAACVLAWQFFYPQEKLPLIVELIGDQDIWRFAHGDDTWNLHYGLDLFDISPLNPFWKKYLRPGLTVRDLEPLLAPGRAINAYETKRRARMVREYAYETEIAGYSAVACNLRGNSAMFAELEKRYEICIAYMFNGERYQISLYTIRDHIDVSKICAHYGGGGHAKAAGFYADALPWPLGGNRLASKKSRA